MASRYGSKKDKAIRGKKLVYTTIIRRNCSGWDMHWRRADVRDDIERRFGNSGKYVLRTIWNRRCVRFCVYK